MGLPSWVPDDETKPAPFPLLLVQSFVNTWEGESGTDLLAGPATARRWLAAAGLLEGKRGPGDHDLDLARRVREDIRSLLVHNSGGPAPAAAELRALQELSRASRFAATMAPDGRAELEVVAGGPLRLGELLLIIRDSQQDSTWARLKACRNGECRWAYYDRSHAGQGAWCDMAVCGNRLKNRHLRRRKAVAADRATPASGAATDQVQG
jgi:predicted RNA-binding Zn ribbon-like protein